MAADLQSSLNVAELAEYTTRQLNTFFPDNHPVEARSLQEAVAWTLERLHRIHGSTSDYYYYRDGRPFFNHLHGDQYAAYIYLLSRHSILERNDPELAAKLYLLNKALFAVDIYFEVKLPDIFMLCHPIGTVLGRASYQDCLIVHQNCTVGGINDIYPTLGFGVVLSAGASVLGKSELGDSVCVGAGALVVNAEIPPNRTVVGRAEAIRILPGHSTKWKTFFDRVESPT